MFDDLASWLNINLIGTVYKILAKLGLGVVTFGGFQVLYENLRESVLANVGGITGSIYQFLTISGSMDAMGIILGAYALKVVFLAFGKFGVLPT